MIYFNKLNFTYNELKISEKSLLLLEELFLKFSNYSENFFSKNKKYDKNELFENELKKSFIRVLICYDKFALDFTNSVLTDLKSKFQKNIFFETENPNLMIHLAEDYSEEGSFHYDQIGNNETITIWTPITDYNYNALSYFNFGTFFYKILKKTKLIKLFKPRDILAKKFKSLIWNGYFIHKGCLNTSRDISAAIVVSARIIKKENNYNLKYYNFIEKEIKSDFEKIISLSNHLKNNDVKTVSIKKVTNIISHINFYCDNKIISKILSVVAQRLEKIKRDDFQNLSIFLDMASYILDENNYASTKRLKNKKYIN